MASEKVLLFVAADQASHGARFVLQSQDGTVYFRTPGNKTIDRVCAEECARRWNVVSNDKEDL